MPTKMFLAFFLFLLLANVPDAQAGTIVTLSAVDTTAPRRRSLPPRDFIVEIRNDSDHPINLMWAWDNHVLVVDGKRYPVVSTAWWCLKSPRLKPGEVFRRPMHLSYYPGMSLDEGAHEIQMEFGSQTSNQLAITTVGPRQDFTRH